LPPAERIPAVTEAIDAVRPVAMTATEAFLARAMQDALAGAFGDIVGETRREETYPVE
jgi:hypothetical protein